MEYPKIETLFERDTDESKGRGGLYSVIVGQFKRPEFDLVDRWLVTEKVDGTNVRVLLEDGVWVGFKGRTDNAQIPPFLLEKLQQLFPLEKVAGAFDLGTSAVLFGEGYGARIQKGGGNYREGVSFRLIDVAVIGADGFIWWLNWPDVKDVACKLGIETVPVFGVRSTDEIVRIVRNGMDSAVAHEENGGKVTPAEGVVCRTDPLLFTRLGHRLVWKLKTRDF